MTGADAPGRDPERTWDSAWDDVFGDRSWGRYPPEELIAFMMHRYPDVDSRRSVRVLEVGCGPGANVWYLAREGFVTYGVDGSPIAVGQAGRRLTAVGLEATLSVADLAALPFDDGYFDTVVDISAVQHNRLDDQRRILAEIHRVLTPGGRFFSLLLGSPSWGEGTGECLEPHTYDGVTEGPLARCGVVRYTPETGLAPLFASFAEMGFERRTRTYEQRRRALVTWIVTARR